jgi:hypothetical protein
MASSENQGLQIALIIFVMLTIVLSVTTFVFFRQYEEADIRARKDHEDVAKANTSLSTAVSDIEALNEMIGVSKQAKTAEVKTTFDEDKKSFMATIPEPKQFYHAALEYTYSTLHEKDLELASARAEIQTITEERNKIEAAKQAQVAAAEQKQKQAEEALGEANKIFAAEREKKNQELDGIKAELDKKLQELTELAEQKKKEIDALADERNKLVGTNSFLREKIIDLDPTSGFEVPDGKIVWVNQKARSAWINVGQADGLQRQVTFSIVGNGETVGGDQKTKGRIEVTEILAPHFARCRILQDELYDPIVQDDLIFTPLWQPGRSESFALIGKFDLDGDGVDDREMVRDLIRMAGGRIDAEVGLDGKQTGQLTINTRYLIKGGEPDDKAVEGAYSKMVGEAQRLGVRDLDIAKFLDHVGWKDPKKTLVFGRHGNAQDVPVEQPDGGRGVSPGHVSGQFRARRPPGRGGPGATPAGSDKKSAY